MTPDQARNAVLSALQLHQAGRFAEAEPVYRRVLAAYPGHPDTLHLLGVLRHQIGDSKGGVELIAAAVKVHPNNPDYFSNLGEAHRALAQLKEAQSAYEQAIRLAPNHSAALSNLALVLDKQGYHNEAETAARKAIAVEPTLGGAWVNLGNALASLNRNDESIAAFERALSINPNMVSAYNDLALVLRRVGRMDDAIAVSRHVVTSLNPKFAEGWSNLGNFLYEGGYLMQALEAHRNAIALNDKLATNHGNIATTLNNLAMHDEALHHYRRGLELDPAAENIRSSYLITLHYPHGDNGQLVFEAHRDWGKIHGTVGRPPAVHVAPTGRPVKMAVVSPDFRRHSVSYFLLPLLQNLDRERFELHLYSDALREDAYTDRYRALGRTFTDATVYPMFALEDVLRAGKFDLLLEVAGHTMNNRLPVLAHRPVPTQVTWLGYPNTTGLTEIDFRITDSIADPPGQTDAWHTETLARIDPCFLCYEPYDKAPDVVQTRPEKVLRFGSFNAFSKLSARTIALYSRVLHEVPGSILMLKYKPVIEPLIAANVRDRFAAHGIDPARIQLCSRDIAPEDHLARYGTVDVALDTYPYTGTTTTCEALWQGVPVVSLAGPTHVSRVGASLLTTIGLQEYITTTDDQYVATAVALANDPDRRLHLRTTMRDRLRNSPLMNAPAFARRFEAALEKMLNRTVP